MSGRGTITIIASVLGVAACSSENTWTPKTPNTVPWAQGTPCVERCPAPGTSESFWVRDFRDPDKETPQFVIVEAQQMAASENYLLYVDSAHVNTITANRAIELLETLDQATGQLSHIYGGTEGPVPAPVTLLICSILDDTIREASVAGYFAPRDIFLDRFTSELLHRPEHLQEFPHLEKLEDVNRLRGRSNERWMVYLDADDLLSHFDSSRGTPSDLDRWTETAVHELSHLWVYHARVVARGVPNHDTWLSEGLAEVAPQLILMGQTHHHDRLRQLREPLTLEALATAPSMFDFKTYAAQTTSQLQLHLFFSYILDRLPTHEVHSEFVNALVRSPVADLDTMSTTLKELGLELNLVFRDWALTNLAHSLGRSVASIDGFPVPRERWRYQPTSPASTPLPETSFAFSSFKHRALPPGSYGVHRHHWAEEIQYEPAASGIDERLEVATVMVSDRQLHVVWHSANTSIVLPAEELAYLLFYNPLDATQSLSVGVPPSAEEVFVDWLGEGRPGWQVGLGARAGTAPSFFQRTTGVAVHHASHHGGDEDYVYVADALNQTVSRWRLADGSAAGQIGSPSHTCDDDSPDHNGWHERPARLLNNHCRRNFSSPRGISVDSKGFIYVADKNNHRVVKWAPNGQFVAWLGHPTNDHWQHADGGYATQGIKLGYSLQATQLNSPWGLAIDESSPNPDQHYLYISCYGTSVVVRRHLHTGAYAGVIGNGHQGWNLEQTQFSGRRGRGATYFHFPKGIAVRNGEIYIADEGNHRISRWTLDGHALRPAGTPLGWLGAAPDNFSDDATGCDSSMPWRLCYPADVHAAMGFIFVADRGNGRVVRWTSGGQYAGQVGGTNSTRWHLGPMSAAVAPSWPVSAYPASFMKEPHFLWVEPWALDADKADYLYVTTVHNARLTRWHLNTLEKTDERHRGSSSRWPIR